MSPVVSSRDGVLIDVHVSPSARTESVIWCQGVLKAKVRAPRDKGKANKALIGLLKPFFGECEIVKGFKNPRKTLLVKNTDIGALDAVLEGLAGE